MRSAIFLMLLLSGYSFADSDTEWVVRLDCDSFASRECYAASNGSYASINGARRFATRYEAETFSETLTFSLRMKSPRVVEIVKQVAENTH
ncbi:hypothetical protein [Kistimonas asteriae]|uniref:hypothetical protein n=1 Tax=Kistimonas asteriae TaxID=517724 RepID=UPI001BAB6B4A|nr:hypothetical protein [Kistimonas asteriae]